MREFRKNIRGRGASSHLPNRFDSSHYVPEPQEWENYIDDEKPLLRTRFVPDTSRSIITENNSPDVGFRFSLNPYRGCEHGCAYCYARPSHEFLGHSAGLDFESIIYVKERAPELLTEKFMSKSWRGETVAMSGITDCYQPIERRLRLTRRCLEVFVQFRNPVTMITKNALIARDADLLSELARYNAACATISLTTLDDELASALEPRTSRPRARLEAIKKLADAGVPVGVNIAPVIPGLNDFEIPALLEAAREAGATHAGMTPVRLPLAVNPIFEEWLDVHRPLKKEKILNLIREIRGGRLNDPRFGTRMRGEGVVAHQIHQMFSVYKRRFNFKDDFPELTGEHFQRPTDQMSFDLTDY